MDRLYCELVGRISAYWLTCRNAEIDVIRQLICINKNEEDDSYKMMRKDIFNGTRYSFFFFPLDRLLEDDKTLDAVWDLIGEIKANIYSFENANSDVPDVLVISKDPLKILDFHNIGKLLSEGKIFCKYNDPIDIFKYDHCWNMSTIDDDGSDNVIFRSLREQRIGFSKAFLRCQEIDKLVKDRKKSLANINENIAHLLSDKEEELTKMSPEERLFYETNYGDEISGE